MELDFLKNEKEHPLPPSPFIHDRKPAEKIHINHILVENHELREKQRQQVTGRGRERGTNTNELLQEEEISGLRTNIEQLKKKFETERLSLMKKIDGLNKLVESGKDEKKDMREKLARSEKEMYNLQLSLSDLIKGNIALEEELRVARKSQP